MIFLDPGSPGPCSKMVHLFVAGYTQRANVFRTIFHRRNVYLQQSNQGCKRIWSRLVRRPEKCPHRPTGGGASPHDFHHDSSPRPDSFTLACAVLLSQFFHVKKSIPSLRNTQNEVKCSNFIGWKKYRVVCLVTEIGKGFATVAALLPHW